METSVNYRKSLPAIVFAGVVAMIVGIAVEGCEKVDTGDAGDIFPGEELISKEEIAQMLASVPLGVDRIGEVFDAVSSSDDNGYDEEYMISDLLSSPGRGVGEQLLKSSSLQRKAYNRPMKELFEDFCTQKATSAETKGLSQVQVSSRTQTQAQDAAQAYLKYLEDSGMQIYWPDFRSWDGKQSPVVTFAPEDESADSNVGWFLNEDGEVEQVLVDEAMAETRPVWVINSNDDSPFISLEVLKKNNPDWQSGGNIEIEPTRVTADGRHQVAADGQNQVTAKKNTMLVLKKFKMLRHYDSWLRGASEFQVRLGAINSFTASTEAELKLYNPEITDFMIVVKRKELNIDKELGVILMTDWTEQLEDCAFMITEDDGGTRTSWKCSGTVKINSKSYGFEVNLPLNSYDDIVWRGKLSRKYLNSAPEITGRFGDTELTFATLAY